MTPEDKKFERIAQRHIADLKKSSKAIVEDAAVLAAHKVMAEFAQGAHTEAKVEYHTTMIQCPHCDGSVRVQAQPYPDNFIHALMYDVAKRDSEAQQQEPVAVARVDDLERGGRVRALAMGLGLDAALYTSPPASKPLTDESIKIMREMLEVQGQPGNWNYDSYMHGLYNGMEYMVALAEKREPQFRDAPETWLAKYEVKRNNFNNTEAIEQAHGIKGSA